MDFFDKLGKKASDAYKVTAEKTNKLTKEAKLKMKNNENKSAIDDLYKAIGKKIYEKHVAGDNVNIKDDLEEELTKIDVLSAEIEANLNECLELNNKIKCDNCSTLVDKEFKFCPKCGKEIKVAEVIETQEEAKKAKEAKEVEIIEEEKIEKENTTENE